MKYIIYSTDDPQPLPDDDSVEAKFYRKHDLKEVFESYLAWGPTYLEIHCHLTPAKRKLIVDSMYYLEHDNPGHKTKAPREHVETLCNVFDIPIKPLKKGK